MADTYYDNFLWYKDYLIYCDSSSSDRWNLITVCVNTKNLLNDCRRIFSKSVR